MRWIDITHESDIAVIYKRSRNAKHLRDASVMALSQKQQAETQRDKHRHAIEQQNTQRAKQKRAQLLSYKTVHVTDK